MAVCHSQDASELSKGPCPQPHQSAAKQSSLELQARSLGSPTPSAGAKLGLCAQRRCGKGGEGSSPPLLVFLINITIPSPFVYCSLQSITGNFLVSPKLERPDQKYRVSQLRGARSGRALATAPVDNLFHWRHPRPLPGRLSCCLLHTDMCSSLP